MLILISGQDISKARKKFSDLLASLIKKHKDSSLFLVDSDNFTGARFEEFISGQTLFYSKFVVGCDNILANKEANQFIEEHLADLKKSENAFVFLEKEADEGLGYKIKKAALQVSEYEIKPTKFVEKFNLFSISDDFGKRDKQNLWVLIQKALRQGIQAEELFWKINWILTNMLAVNKSKKPESLGLKPNVLSNARSFAKNYSTEEMEKISCRLMDIYDRCRLGEGEFETELEKLVLAL